MQYWREAILHPLACCCICRICLMTFSLPCFTCEFESHIKCEYRSLSLRRGHRNLQLAEASLATRSDHALI